MELFRNRDHAGERLAEVLAEQRNDIEDGVVLALPRGGVPVAAQVATRLNLPLDVFIVRKLGLPGHSEYAMGAIASGGLTVINEDAVARFGIDQATIDHAARTELLELERREQVYRGRREPLDLAGRSVMVVDDGIATGASMRAAVEAIATHNPRFLHIAVPVAPKSCEQEFRPHVDEFTTLATPTPFHAVGLWYTDFTQITDDEVRTLLNDARDPE